MSGNPFERVALADLQRRTSMKWRTFPADVLPLWVAEMDVALADAVVHEVAGTMRAGDTGYPAGLEYAQAMASFVADRWQWDGLAVERSMVVSDVMTGVVESLRLVTARGNSVVVNCPVYRPSMPSSRREDVPLVVDFRWRSS